MSKLIKKILIIAIPTYLIAFLTEAMVYTMPTLAITTLIAVNLYEGSSRNVENRIDEDGDGGEDGNILDGDE